MLAKIYKPVPSAMTSGRSKQNWILEFDKSLSATIDPLTGTKRSKNIMTQVNLEFKSRDEAITYAKMNNIPHRVIERQEVNRIKRSYADNFSFDRKVPWTH
ncbi:MAG: ETC complex I subunit [Hellea sp.]|nr:ETC complex I subunit [Hellea sp.]MBT4995916.1 ETC complex I subunit [Hellea sp.]